MLLTAVLLLALGVAGLMAQTAPQFTQEMYEISVNESNEAMGFPRPQAGFLQAACIDPDTNATATDVVYSIIISDMLPFDINSTGALLVNADLDYESVAGYSFEVVCSNSSAPDLNDTASVRINLLPVNEFRPEVSRSAPFVTFPETTAVGDFIKNISAEAGVTDQDASPDNNVTYTLANVDDAQYFEVDMLTGIVTLREVIDLDNVTVVGGLLRITITACDIDPPTPLCPNIQPVLRVTAVNEFSPQFSQAEYNTSVAEDRSTSETILQSPCTDQDIGVGAFDRITFGVDTPQIVRDTFSIDSSTGAITLTQMLDYEQVQSYEFTLECRDTGNPVMTSLANVTITVENVNDNVPQFTGVPTGQVQVNDRTTPGSVVTTIECTDQDVGTYGEVSFSISDNTTFTINTITGEVTVVDSLLLPQGEFTRTYMLIISCEDGGLPSLSNETMISLLVYRDDSNPPIIQNAQNLVASASEGADRGDVVITLSASDSDSPDIEFSFEDESVAGVFSIDSSTGVITVAQSLDRETIESYQMTVVVTEVRVAPGSPRSSSASLTITIDDVNDNVPQFTGVPTEQVQVNDRTTPGSVVTTIECTDQDVGTDGEVSFSISDNTTFAINTITGEVTVVDSLLLPQGEFTRTYMLIISCEDGGLPSLSNETMISLLVYRDDSNPPIIQNAQNLVASASEGADRGDVVITLSASDSDSPDIEFSFEDESVAGVFSIDSSTGVITVAQSLDRETIESYQMTVVVTEVRVAPGLSRSSSASLTITIDDVNDNPPSCNQTQFSVTLTVGTHSQESILNVSCTDADTGQNAELTYSISGSTTLGSGTLSVNANTGELTFDGAVENTGTFQTAIAVTDGGDTPLSSTITVTITVVDSEGSSEGSSGGVPIYAIVAPIIVVLVIVAWIIFAVILAIVCLPRRKKRMSTSDVVADTTGEFGAVVVSNIHSEDTGVILQNLAATEPPDQSEGPPPYEETQTEVKLEEAQGDTSATEPQLLDTSLSPLLDEIDKGGKLDIKEDEQKGVVVHFESTPM